MNHSRISRAASALMLAMVVSVWLAPGAHAQVGSLEDTVDSVGDTVGGITTELEGGSSGSDAGSETTTDDGGGGGGLIGGVVGSIEKTVENSKETVTEVTETTQDTLGTVGSGTLEGVAGTVEGTVGKLDSDRSRKDSTRQGNTRSVGSTSTPTAGTAQVLGASLAEALRKDSRTIAASPTSASTIASSPVGQSLVQQIGRVAAEAVKQAAFPIALILLVVGFLMVQNRMDSKDPKLALAPVDSQHDSLSFT